MMASVTLADVPQALDSKKLHCSNGALTGSLGLLVQALLAIVAFGALVGEFVLQWIYTNYMHMCNIFRYFMFIHRYSM